MIAYLIIGIILGGAIVWLLRTRAASDGIPILTASLPHAHPSDGTTMPPPAMGARSPVAPATGPAPHENVIEGVAGDVKGKTFAIDRRIATIGRSPANYVQTVDPSASRVHCQLRSDDAGLWLTDMTTRNGTLVNDERVTARTKLADGDLISIGSAVFRFRAAALVAEDAALRPKRADAAAKAETAPLMGGKKPLHGLVHMALQASNGDIQQAAKALEVDVHTIVEILKDKHE